MFVVNFHHEHSIVPTNYPWVSEDAILLKTRSNQHKWEDNNAWLNNIFHGLLQFINRLKAHSVFCSPSPFLLNLYYHHSTKNYLELLDFWSKSFIKFCFRACNYEKLQKTALVTKTWDLTSQFPRANFLRYKIYVHIISQLEVEGTSSVLQWPQSALHNNYRSRRVAK